MNWDDLEGGARWVVITNFWSIVLDDHRSKKIYRPKINVDVRCYIHLRWSCWKQRVMPKDKDDSYDADFCPRTYFGGRGLVPVGEDELTDNPAVHPHQPYIVAVYRAAVCCRIKPFSHPYSWHGSCSYGQEAIWSSKSCNKKWHWPNTATLMLPMQNNCPFYPPHRMWSLR